MSEKEYIERGAFLRKCAEAFGHYGVAIKVVEGVADKCKAADVVEVRHGEWEIVIGSNGKEKMVCTNCRHQQDLASTFTYCPNCGARMSVAKTKGGAV